MKLPRKYSVLRILFYSCFGAIYLGITSLLVHGIANWLAPTHQVKIEQSSMRLDPNEKILLVLAAVGAMIAVGKLLAGGDKVTLRLMVGRIIIGAGLSVAAAATLAMQPNLSEAALIGIGAAIGILGQAFLESILQRWLSRQ